MSDVSATGTTAVSASPAARFTEEPVVWVHRWSAGLMSFRVRRDPAYRFAPGQFARIGLRKENGELIWRAYSVVSAPHQPFLEFFLVILPTGEFSSRVGRFNVGDSMLVEQVPQGFLTVDRFKQPGREQDLWLMGTGTGLAPYISMLRDEVVWQRFEHIVLVLSVRERQDLGYTEELEQLAAAHAKEGLAKFHFVKTLTRDTLHGALHGRINALLESGDLESAAGVALSDARSRFMLCGNPQMVEGMRTLLKSRGFRMNRKLEPGHIIVENYW
ncbi:MAG: ferredoxin--NADP reductase [Betaproteobacteria bacterium]|nr:ferredoxin--NADP reductase [Betaproteobacteria bacterium]